MNTNQISIPKSSFYLRKPRGKNKDRNGIIYLRYFVRGKYVEHSTNIELQSKEWDNNKQAVNSSNKNWKRINAELESIKAKFDTQLKEYEDLIKKGSQIAVKCKKDSEDRIVIERIKPYSQWLKEKGVI